MSTRSPVRCPSEVEEPSRPLEALSDAEIVGRCAGGDARAWCDLVQRFRTLIYAIPLRMGLTPGEADDVFQITFTRLAERIAGLNEPHRVRAWLVTTARRASLKALRRPRHAHPEELTRLVDPGALPSEELERLQDEHLLHRALACMGERCRELLTRLYFPEDPAGRVDSYETVAKQLGIPVGSVGPTRIRCLEKLLGEFKRLSEES